MVTYRAGQQELLVIVGILLILLTLFAEVRLTEIVQTNAHKILMLTTETINESGADYLQAKRKHVEIVYKTEILRFSVEVLVFIS